MKGDPNFVVLKYPGWLDAAKFEDKILGAIVRYPFKPTNEYLPDSPLRYNKNDLVEGCFTNFLHDNTETKSRDASAALESLVGFKWQGSKEEIVRLQGKLLRVKRLQQHAQFWSQLKTDEAVRNAVPDWISLLNTWPPCLVVGVMIAEDVELDFSGARERRREGVIEAPVATVALTAAGVPSALLGVDVGNPQVSVGSGGKTATVFRASSAQRSIFALELRIVTTAFLRRRELALKEDGPKVYSGRLADGEQNWDSEDSDGAVGVEDLILEIFTQKEYSEMN
ncbi:hypothetical protein PFICI_02503 [Pestalotiopsis fici W106-1]|uniref:Uncharacterized protein n=1 Tax=Pestalotiopsis fici (strain W106-1 / CGMCC3.15140) TaxID=1229662 RepID=W3XEF1_PESFW|nr:uncharacterized protein PFICI_02503 [Pestalotiopsis fici W106-1]ETS84478.1 hypothetical protein PFICI_02503 [Pestalotiopsis fici W106-1]